MGRRRGTHHLRGILSSMKRSLPQEQLRTMRTPNQRKPEGRVQQECRRASSAGVDHGHDTKDTGATGFTAKHSRNRVRALPLVQGIASSEWHHRIQRIFLPLNPSPWLGRYSKSSTLDKPAIPRCSFGSHSQLLRSWEDMAPFISLDILGSVVL